MRYTHGIQEGAEDGQDNLFVWTRRDICNGLDALDWEHTRRHVHGLACQSKQQAQDLGPVALKLLGGGDRRVATYATLPYRIRDLVLACCDLGKSEFGEEEKVNQRVDNLLGQRLGFLELGLLLCGRLLWVGLVEDDLASHQLAPPTALPPRSPEKVVLPCLEMVGLIQKGQ